MSAESTPTTSGRRTPLSRLVRHHLALVLFCLLQGVVIGLWYASSGSSTYTSTARVLINPVVGNPFVPTSSAVRQDEATNLETEAQVARSEEVVGQVVAEGVGSSVEQVQRNLQVVIPPNTQVLEMTFTAGDPDVARRVADVVASVYLANRTRRFDEVNSARLERVEGQISGVVADLQVAVDAAQRGSAADREFQAQLATALRNQLVSLRAQQTALQNSDGPAGSIISPATTPLAVTDYMTVLVPALGGLVGLAVGLALALALERVGGVVRSVSEVEDEGLPVAFAVPAAGRLDGLRRRPTGEALDDTVRRVRAEMLALDPRPQVIAVAPAGAGASTSEVAGALAESLARAGHRVVLVHTDQEPATAGVGPRAPDGLAQALLHERLDVVDLLHPGAEPLLCLLPSGGFTPQSRELLVVDNVRAVVAPLVEAGNLVVLQSPGIASVEGEAIVGAADLGLVVVTTRITRTLDVRQAARRVESGATPLAAMVLGPRDGAARVSPAPGQEGLDEVETRRDHEQPVRLRP